MGELSEKEARAGSKEASRQTENEEEASASDVTMDDVLAALLAEEDDDDSTAEEALLAICLSAQEDRDFGAAAVIQILSSMGLERMWKQAAQLSREVEEEAEDVEETNPGMAFSDPEPDDGDDGDDGDAS